MGSRDAKGQRTPARGRRLIGLVTGLVIAIAALSSTARAQNWSAVEAAAKQEGTLTLYHNLRPVGVEPLMAEFQRAHPGIRVEQVRLASAALFERFGLEYASGRAQVDAVVVLWDARLREWMQKGWMSEWTPPASAAYPPAMKIENRMWTVQWYREGIIYNKSMVPPGGEPKEWVDLLDPRWRGKVTMNPPWRSVSVQQTVYLWERQLGIKDFAERLKANGVKFFEGSSGVLQAVIRGDATIGHITDLVVNPAIEDGAPIGIVYPRSGVPVSRGVAFVPAKAPHGNAGRVLVNWLLTREGQLALQKHSGLAGSLPGLPPLQYVPATSTLNAVDNERVLTPAIQTEMVVRWRKVFGVE